MAGQIIPRGPGKWLVRAFVSSEVKDGRRVKHYTAKTIEGTFKQAQKECAALTIALDEGSYIPPATQTLKQFVNWWLTDVAGANVEAGSQRSYTDRVTPFLEHAIGNLKLDKVTTPALQRALHELAQSRQWSRRTTAYTRTVLSMAFGKAVRLGVIRSNPCAEIELPKRPTNRPDDAAEELQVWTQEQVQTFLEAAKDSPLFPLWHLLLNTGMRPGEALGLQWRDLKGSNISIRRAIKQGKKQSEWLVGPPKTKRSTRTISLPSGTVRVLKAHRLLDQKDSPEWIFGMAGGFRNIRQIMPAWEAAVKASRLPRLTLYGCRHTHATLLLSMGVPVKVVSERLGHSNVSITMDVYQHVMPHMQTEVAEQLERALGG